jgi:uncharacterized protein (DUF2236 family)
MWVHATLVRTALDVYQRYVGALTIAEQRLYYDEQKTLAEMFGVPRERMPDTFAAFNRYVDDTLESDRIAVTAALCDVVDAILRPELPFIARPLVDALNLATVGLLPARLREELHLRWSPTRERLLEASRATLRGIIPALPILLREQVVGWDVPSPAGARRRTAGPRGSQSVALTLDRQRASRSRAPGRLFLVAERESRGWSRGMSAGTREEASGPEGEAARLPGR